MTKLIAFANDMNGIRTEYHRVRGQKTVHISYVVLSARAYVTYGRTENKKNGILPGALCRPQALLLGIRRGTQITNNSAAVLDGTFKRRIYSFLCSNPSTN